HQARVRRARDEQLALEEREERELQRLEEQHQHQQLEPQEQQQHSSSSWTRRSSSPSSSRVRSSSSPQPAAAAATSSSCLGSSILGLPSPSPPSSASPPVYGPTFPPPDSSPAVFPSSPPLSSSPPSRSWATRRSPRARPSSPVPSLTFVLPSFFLVHLVPSQSVLPSPPESALTVSLPTPVTDYYRTYLTDFASTRRLDYATTTLVAAPPTSPLAVGGVSALGRDALEDRQFELEFLAAASPHLCAMLLAPEGDPDALDIPTPRTYAEAVSGPWASQWRAAMDAEMASYRSTGTYVDEVPPPWANVVDGMWIYRVKRPPGSPPVFKARYVARGFSQREGVDFFQTFAPTPKMTTLRVLLHVA
ncbi:unnamed protein product, partial [Closterium sp. NIES-64]